MGGGGNIESQLSEGPEGMNVNGFQFERPDEHREVAPITPAEIVDALQEAWGKLP